MKPRTAPILLLSTSLITLACSNAPLEVESESSDAISIPVDGTVDACAVLYVANRATLTQLDVDAALDSRAANGIVARRAGADKVDGTDDDKPFLTIKELDDISYVATTAFTALRAYAAKTGVVDACTPSAKPDSGTPDSGDAGTVALPVSGTYAGTLTCSQTDKTSGGLRTTITSAALGVSGAVSGSIDKGNVVLVTKHYYTREIVGFPIKPIGATATQFGLKLVFRDPYSGSNDVRLLTCNGSLTLQ